MKQYLKCLTIVALISLLASPKVSKPITVSVQPAPLQAVIEVVQTPAIEPIPEPVVYPAGCANYVSVIEQYDWDVSIAVAVARAESGCRPDATNSSNYNGSVDRGFFQVNSIHADMVGGELDKLYIPTTNIKVAYSIYTSSGWRAWSAYNNGSYLKYLN